MRQPIQYEALTNGIDDNINDELYKIKCYISEEKKVKDQVSLSNDFQQCT